jgi:hypothetical protein
MAKQKSFSVKVGKLAKLVKGEVLNSADETDELVENLMVGAMCLDPAPSYLNLRPNKAVITRGDRSDMQLASLESSTKCLILTDNIKPISVVFQLAQEKKVPIIMVQSDTMDTLSLLEKGL